MSEGRAVSLPASAVGAAKLATNVVGAYARIRKQFRVPIAEMGGVQEALARIASETFILTSAQSLVNAMLANHEQPAVLSAVMKYETTSRSRLVVNDAMDVMGGAGICRGPNNVFGNGYMAQPIAITVEGANILTRCLMIFGQGLNRAHPNLINIINTIEKGDDPNGFMKEVGGMISHFGVNAARSLSGAVIRPMSKANLSTYYEGQLSRLASNFAVTVDLALVLGGGLKTAEMVSGRLADAFSTLYLGYACVWFYNRNRQVQGIDTIFELAMENILAQNQAALKGVAANFPVPGIGTIMSALTFPLGSPFKGPSDALRVKATKLITLESGIRSLLSEGIFISKDKDDRVRMMNDALPLVIKTDAMLAKAKKEKRALTPEEQKEVDKVAAIVDRIIQVDSFEKLGIEKHMDDNYVRPALRGTRFVEEKVPVHARSAASARA